MDAMNVAEAAPARFPRLGECPVCGRGHATLQAEANCAARRPREWDRYLSGR